MVIDDEALVKAREAGAKLAEAERGVLVARAELHALIRRLHLAGASFRELGAELGLSHQRVQQIVEAGGGSWWSRLRRNRELGPEATCTVCQRPPSEVAKLVAGPTVFLCDRCLAAAEEAAVLGRSDVFTRQKARKGKCSFCGTAPPEVVSERLSLCAGCRATAKQIMADRRADPV